VRGGFVAFFAVAVWLRSGCLSPLGCLGSRFLGLEFLAFCFLVLLLADFGYLLMTAFLMGSWLLFCPGPTLKL
jgi:hypothetical protein